jgi:hypothetical protein
MHRATRKLKFREIMIGVIVVMALCVSAISACACTHHQPRRAAEPPASCHSATHAEMAEVSPDQLGSDSFDADCNCFVNTPVPAIVSKSENKKVRAEQAQAITIERYFPVEFVQILSEGAASDFAFADQNYTSRLRRSGPSRAPPRL